MPSPQRPPDAARCGTANPEGEPLSGAHGRAVVVEVGRRRDGEPPGHELRHLQRGQARGVEEDRAGLLGARRLAGEGAAEGPRAFCSLTWKPAARASPAAKIAAVASAASDQRMRRLLTPTLRRLILPALC